MNTEVSGILLAAGQSKRFGSQKLLHPLPDTQVPVAVKAAQNLLQALPNSVAVVRPNDQHLKEALLPTGIELIDNPNASQGMSSSIVCGIESLMKNDNNVKIRGWIIALADMPFIPPEIIEQVANTLHQGALLCAPQYKKQRGHPVGFSSQLKAELLALQGDNGARSVLSRHSDQLKLLEVPSESILRDIDYITDLESI